MEIRSNEQILTEYMQKHYSDEKLAALLAHAEDGKLSYFSCCCFIGVATADHALRGYGEYMTMEDPVGEDHYDRAYEFLEALDVEEAFGDLAVDRDEEDEEDADADKKRDAERRARLIPLIHAEIKRRDDLKSESPQVIENQILRGPKFSMIG